MEYKEESYNKEPDRYNFIFSVSNSVADVKNEIREKKKIKVPPEWLISHWKCL